MAARLAANLRSPAQLALYLHGFFLMGGFVAVYNYLGFHLIAPPFSLPAWIVSLLFVAYLAGTFSSPWAGALVARRGRLGVLLAAILIAVAGLALMALPSTPAVIAGLLVFTAGFFAAHTVVSGWAPASARPDSRAQASALYYLGYYGGSSLFGWCLGLVFAGAGWGMLLLAVFALCAASAALAMVFLRTPPISAAG